MRSLICPECGNTFTANAARATFCGPECRLAADRVRGRERYAANRKSPKALCAFAGGCDKPVVNRGLCSGHNEQRRKGQPLRPLRWSRGAGRARQPKPVRDLVCPECGKPFSVPGGMGRTVYCSPGCAYAAKLVRERERQSTYRLMRPPCEFPGCDNPISSRTLCAGHKAQECAGKPLWPLREPCPRQATVTVHPVAVQQIAGSVSVSWLLPPHDNSRPRGTPCPFLECGRPIFCRGLCAGHYSQATNGRPLVPLRRQRRWHEPRAQCVFPRCGDPVHSMNLCMRHDSQRRKTSIPVERYVAFAASLDGRCSYCTEGLVGKFEIDHAHDGNCGDGHRDEFMCADCIRGFVHRQCNEELKWLERAMCAGRVAQPAPDVARYLAARPFQEQTRG